MCNLTQDTLINGTYTRSGSRNEEKGEGTLLLAGDSVHSAPDMGSGGMPQENFEIGF